MATSRDRGTANQQVDQGYGVITDLTGNLIPDLIMTSASQEHGILSIRPGARSGLPDLPIGTRIRVLPNHACATAAQHNRYAVIADGGNAEAPEIIDIWPRLNGW